MDKGLPSEIMLDVLSRIPLKSLDDMRFVSKEWCDYIYDPYLATIHGERGVPTPTPIMFHLLPPSTLSFHVLEPFSFKGQEQQLKQLLQNQEEEQPQQQDEDEDDGYGDIMVKRKLDAVLEYEFEQSPPYRYPKVIGCCNGLLYLSEDPTTLVVIHPLRKQGYKLPPLPLPLAMASHFRSNSCGLGFDASTNTLKMVCVYTKYGEHDFDLYTVVHVIGTNSWREIPQNPPISIGGEAIFAHGCLFWLEGIYNMHRETCISKGRQVIWFDVRNEEFGLIGPPKLTWGESYFYIADQLVDLNGEVGFACTEEETMEIWVLKKRINKWEWVLHCKIDNPYDVTAEVLGCWNKKGDILLKYKALSVERKEIGDEICVYNLKTGNLRKVYTTNGVEAKVEGVEAKVVMYPNTLFLVHGIINNTFSFGSKSGHF